MRTMIISLPDHLRSFVEEQASQRGYGTASEYVRELLQKDQKRLPPSPKSFPAGTATARSAPPGWPAVTPRIITPDVRGVADFIKAVLGATGDVQVGRPTELRIEDSVVLVSDGAGLREFSPAFLHVYVRDTDGTFRRALELGATEVEAPADMPYGDRRAMVRDPWGNLWQLATRREDR